jgi:hypothetical protein
VSENKVCRLGISPLSLSVIRSPFPLSVMLNLFQHPPSPFFIFVVIFFFQKGRRQTLSADGIFRRFPLISIKTVFLTYILNDKKAVNFYVLLTATRTP